MAPDLTCPACAAPLRPGKKFCVGCGARIPPHLQALLLPPADPPTAGAPVQAPAPVSGPVPPPAAGAPRSAPTAPPAPPAGPGAGVLPEGVLANGRYRVERTLGKGGMGAVYLVGDTKLANRPCAMKEMLDYSRNEQEREAAVRRFGAEAETLAALSHAGIPQVYDRFVEWGRYYLVMEFVAGVDLADVLEHHRRRYGAPLHQQEVVRWALQVADVLEYLHGHEPPVVHRDLKPANLILTKGGRVKLVDFGIAKATTGARGTGIGTQGYAPPEQYRGQTEPRSDLYALGASIHHLLTGRDPQFQAPFDFPPLAELLPDVNPALAALVSRLLAMRPADRPGAAEARDALAEAFPGVDPYRSRTADPRLEEIIARALAEKTGQPVPAARRAASAPAPPAAAPAVPAPGPAPQVTAPGGPAPEPQEADPGLCPVCAAPMRPGRKFCHLCGVRLSGPLPRIALRGSSMDLSLRVPDGFWSRHRVERVEFLGPDGAPVAGVLLGVLAGSTGEYAYVARPLAPGSGALAGGAPVEVYLHQESGGERVFTALGNLPDQVSEAITLWQSLAAS